MCPHVSTTWVGRGGGRSCPCPHVSPPPGVTTCPPLVVTHPLCHQVSACVITSPLCHHTPLTSRVLCVSSHVPRRHVSPPMLSRILLALVTHSFYVVLPCVPLRPHTSPCLCPHTCPVSSASPVPRIACSCNIILSFLPRRHDFTRVARPCQFHRHVPYLVDGLWDAAPALVRNWECMTALLLEPRGGRQGERGQRPALSRGWGPAIPLASRPSLPGTPSPRPAVPLPL